MTKAELITKSKHIFGFGGVLATCAGIITDVLTPLSSLGVWAAMVMIGLGLTVMLIGSLKPKAFENADNALRDLWYVPLAVSLFISGGVIASLYQFNKTNGNNQGQIASKVSVVSDFQKQVGLLEEIDRTLKESLIVQKQNLTVQKQSLDQHIGIREDSQELSKTLSFSLDALYDALLRGDVGKLKRFKANGENLGDIYIARNMVEAPLILMAIRHNTRDIDNVLAYLHSERVLDFSASNKIKPAYSAAYNTFWHPFMSESWLNDYVHKGYGFAQFQKAANHDLDYIVPDELKADYENGEVQLIGQPVYAMVSLLTEAEVHENNRAINWLSKHSNNDDISYLLMPNGIKIVL